MEISFSFFKDLYGKSPMHSTGFDTRGGLNIVMVGFDYSEIDEPNRLLNQIEKALDFDLSLLDFWSDEVHNQLINLSPYIQFLEELAKILIKNQDFYHLINFKYIPNNFLEEEFLLSIQSLINFFKHHEQEGAKVFKMKVN